MVIGIPSIFHSGICRRFAITVQAVGETSMPMYLRPSFCATAIAVPQPQKGSRTMSPGLLDALIMRSRRASGFCVGYPSLSFPWAIGIIHVSVGFLPIFFKYILYLPAVRFLFQ